MIRILFLLLFILALNSYKITEAQNNPENPHDQTILKLIREQKKDIIIYCDSILDANNYTEREKRIIWLRLGDTLFMRDNFTKALQSLQKADQVFKDVKDSLFLKSNNLQAYCHFHLDQYDSSILICKNMLKTLNQTNYDQKRLFHKLLGDNYINISRYDSAILYYDSALSFCKKDEHHEEVAKIFLSLGKLYNQKRDSINTLYYYRTALQSFVKFRDPKNTATVYNNLGVFFRIHGEFDSAQHYLNQSLKIRKKINDYTGLISSYGNLGILSYYKGEYENAINNYLKAIKYADSTGAIRYKAYNLNNIGLIYANLKSYEQAIDYLQKSLEVKKDIGDVKGVAAGYNNIGSIYNMLEKYDEAKLFLNKSKETYDKIGLKHETSSILRNLATIEMNLDNFNKAEAYIMESISIDKANSNESDLFRNYLLLSNITESAGKFLESIRYNDTAFSLMNKDLHSDLETVYENYFRLYQSIGSYKKALEYHIKYTSISDSISTQKLKETIAELETKYETAEKERQIDNLEKEKLIQQEKIERAKLTRNSLFVGIGLSVIVAFLIYLINRNRIRTTRLIAAKNLELKEQKISELEKNQQIENMQSMIRGQEEERQRIARELHDEIQNQLVVVKTRLEKLKGGNVNNEDIEEAGKQVDIANEKTRRISHGMVPMVLQRFGLPGAIEQLLSDAKAAQAQLKINKQIIGLDERLDPVVELNLYRISQEIINNMLKHADAKETTLILSKTDHRINLSFEDDGKGFDASDPAFEEGMGMQNIRSRLAILNGSWQIESKANKGTHIEINIPINQNPQNHDQRIHSRRPPGGH